MDEMMTSERRYDATGERFSLPQFFSFLVFWSVFFTKCLSAYSLG